MNNFNKAITAGLLVAFSCVASAGLVKDGIWKIEEGDTLKGVLKITIPDQPLRQKRLTRLAPLINKKAIDKNGRLIVGQNLRLPGVKLPSTVNAADNSDQVGKVLITSGDAVATSDNGEKRSLNRGSVINKGDTIETDSARAQIRFSDGSLVALRPNTSFKVEEYSFNGQQDGSERGIYNLLKGGFRTISGAIGQVNKSNYRVKTPVATIGIRGTHYGITLCTGGSCADRGLKDGLYGGVVDGSISTTNDQGTTIFDNDQYFLIAGIDSIPQELLGPPGVIFDDPQKPAAGNSPQQTENNKPSAKEKALKEIAGLANKVRRELGPLYNGSTDSNQPVTLVFGNTTITIGDPSHPSLDGTPAPNGTVLGVSFATPGDARTFSMLHNGNDQRISLATVGNTANTFVGASQLITGGTNNSIRFIDTDAIANNLSDTGASSNGTGISWGRWSNTNLSASTIVEGQQVTVSTPPTTGFHYSLVEAGKAIRTLQEFDAAKSTEGFSGGTPQQFLIGGTSPTNLSGVTGSLNGGSTNLSIDFASNTITTLNITADISNQLEQTDTYALNNVSPIPISSVITPGGFAALEGNCTGSINCGNGVGLTGRASFTFGHGNNHIGTAVNYAAEASNASANPQVGVAGVVLFETTSQVTPQ